MGQEKEKETRKGKVNIYLSATENDGKYSKHVTEVTTNSIVRKCERGIKRGS